MVVGKTVREGGGKSLVQRGGKLEKAGWLACGRPACGLLGSGLAG
jgi:hypothetical protein